MGHIQEHFSLEIVIGINVTIGHTWNLSLDFGKSIFNWQVGQIQPLHPGKISTEVCKALFQPLLQHSMNTRMYYHLKCFLFYSHTEGFSLMP